MAEFIPICDALILNDNREVLFQKRKITNKPDMWAVPGGKVKIKERLEDAVVREVLEEHDINIRIFKYLQHTEVIRPKNHYLYFTYLAELNDRTPKIMEPDKCSGIGFYSLDNLPEPMTSQTKNYVEKYLRSRQLNI